MCSHARLFVDGYCLNIADSAGLWARPPKSQRCLRLNEVPEITLNLPGDAGCTCVEPVVRDYTFLDKGFAALADGDYEGAIEYFRALSSGWSLRPSANWEAGIAVTLHNVAGGESVLMILVAARRSYRDLLYPELADPWKFTSRRYCCSER